MLATSLLRKGLLPHYAQGKTAFLCIDLQKAFADKIPNFANCVFVANRFAKLHGVLNQHTSFCITEQYPKGLGQTTPDVLIPPSCKPIEKTTFTAFTPQVQECLSEIKNVVVFGIEAHVCVQMTVRDLLDHNYNVYLPVDGIGSQRTSDLKPALKLMRSWGENCVLTTSESIVMQLLRDAKDPMFKQCAKLLQEKPPQQ